MTASTLTEKLTRATKLAYGAGDLGAAIATAINGFFLNAFLLDVAGLRPAMAGSDLPDHQALGRGQRSRCSAC